MATTRTPKFDLPSVPILLHRYAVRSAQRTVAILSLFSGCLLVVLLAKSAFKVDFVATLQVILDGYDFLVMMLVGWLEPWLKTLVEDAEYFLGLQLHLYSHWRHIFVLTGIYYFRDAANFWHSRDVAGAVLMGTLGLAVGLSTSVGAGVISLSRSDIVASLVVVAIPLVGLAVYGSVRAIWASLWYREHPNIMTDYARRLFRAWRDVGIGLVLLSIGLGLPPVRGLASPGMAMLGFLVVCFAIWHLVKGWLRSRPAENNHRFQCFLIHGNTVLGLGMLSIFIGAALFIALNVGLELLGS